jgi:hypothetical protein
MTAPQDFPSVAGTGAYDLPTWAESGTATDPGSGIKASGLSNGSTLQAPTLNYIVQSPDRWCRAFAAGALDGRENLFTTWGVNIEDWTPDGATLDATLAISTMWLDPSSTGATRVQAVCVAGNMHTFTASRDTYVDVSIANMLALHDDATSMEFNEVPNNDPAPAVSAGFVRVWKVVTNGSTVTASTSQIPDRPYFRSLYALELALDNLEVVTLAVSDATTLSGGLDMDGTAISNVSTLATTGNVSIGGALDMTSGAISNVTTIATSGNVSIGGALDMTTGAISGVTTFDATGDCTMGSLSTTGGISCGGNLDMTSGSISNVTTINTSGLATLNSATVSTTLGVTGVLTATGGISLPSGADATGTSGSTFTGGTFDGIDSTGAFKVGELQFYSDATPSTTTGVMQFYGRGLAVGIGSTAKRVAIPYDNYVVDLAQTSSSTATGASVTFTLATGDVVYVTASADLWNDGTGQEIVFEIVIDGSIQNSPGNLRSEVANDPITCSRTVKYTAVADANVTFVQRYGATAGNTTGKNGFISVRHGN